MQGEAAGRGAYRTTDTCVTCGRTIDVKIAAYTGDGMICAECEANVSIEESNVAAASGSGVGALGWAMLSLVCNPLLIPSILAITGGVRELRTLDLFEPAARTGKQVQAIFAIVLGAFWPAMIVGMVGLAMLMGVAGAVRGDRYDEYERYDDPHYDEYDPYAVPVDDDPYYDDGYEAYPDPSYEVPALGEATE